MIGLGTGINAVAILMGGALGFFFGKYFPDRIQDSLNKACGISVIFIGIAGAMEGMLKIQDHALHSGGAVLLSLCMALGSLIGELMDIEGAFEKFGCWLKIKTGNGKDKKFVEGFVMASLTVCIGAMAIVGAVQDGIYGDYSVLAAKAMLDLFIIMIMSCSKGVGCVFSVIPVVILEGTVTALARLLKPLMTQAAMANLSLVGSVLIFCVGLNLVWGKKVRVANMLPAVFLAAASASFPFFG